MDACTRAMVSQPAAQQGSVRFFPQEARSAPPRLSHLCPPGEWHQDTFTTAETAYLTHRRCIVCGSTEGVSALLANPFTVRCHVGICQSCLSS